jgi:hypothetical protein
MQNHGFTTIADDIKKAVFQAYCTQEDARALEGAYTIHDAYFEDNVEGSVDFWGTAKTTTSADTRGGTPSLEDDEGPHRPHLENTVKGSADVAGTGDFNATVKTEGDVRILTEDEATDSWDAIQGTIERPWSLWTREVEVNPL